VSDHYSLKVENLPQKPPEPGQLFSLTWREKDDGKENTGPT
jgi:hypothetical protein